MFQWDVCFLSRLEYCIVMWWVERRITLLMTTTAICCLSHRRREHLQDTKQLLHFIFLCLPVTILMWIRVNPLFHVRELLFVLAFLITSLSIGSLCNIYRWWVLYTHARAHMDMKSVQFMYALWIILINYHSQVYFKR